MTSKFNTILTVGVVLAIVMMSSSGLGAVTGDGTSTNGFDAGDTVATASPLPGPGSYDGVLASATDEDWYATPLSAGLRCISMDATRQHALMASMQVDTVRVDVDMTTKTAASAHMAVQDAETLYAGFDNLYSSTLSSKIEYAFTLSDAASSDLPLLDGGSFSSACVRGQLGKADVSDAYAITGSAGDQVVISIMSIGDRAVTFHLIDPSGNTVLTGVSGDTVGTTLTSAGNWTIDVTAPNGSVVEYLAGLCHPMCTIHG